MAGKAAVKAVDISQKVKHCDELIAKGTVSSFFCLRPFKLLGIDKKGMNVGKRVFYQTNGHAYAGSCCLSRVTYPSQKEGKKRIGRRVKTGDLATTVKNSSLPVALFRTASSLKQGKPVL